MAHGTYKFLSILLFTISMASRHSPSSPSKASKTLSASHKVSISFSSIWKYFANKIT